MARDPKIEVAALNVRIPIDANRDYASLLETISSLKRGIRIHGESYCALRSSVRGLVLELSLNIQRLTLMVSGLISTISIGLNQKSSTI